MCLVSFHQKLKEKAGGCLCTNDYDAVLLETYTKDGKYNNQGYLKPNLCAFLYYWKVVLLVLVLSQNNIQTEYNSNPLPKVWRGAWNLQNRIWP